MKMPLVSNLLNWYEKRLRNKLLISGVTSFVLVYGMTLQLVYIQAADSLLQSAYKESISTTGILAMGLYRSYEIETDRREIQSFILGAKKYRDNVLEISVLDRQLQIVASTTEDLITTSKNTSRLNGALENQVDIEVDLNRLPPNIHVAYPISAGLNENGNH